MVVVGKHFAFLLFCGLVGNPHLTAKVFFFAPLPMFTSRASLLLVRAEKIGQELVYQMAPGSHASSPVVFGPTHGSLHE